MIRSQVNVARLTKAARNDPFFVGEIPTTRQGWIEHYRDVRRRLKAGERVCVLHNLASNLRGEPVARNLEPSEVDLYLEMLGAIGADLPPREGS